MGTLGTVGSRVVTVAVSALALAGAACASGSSQATPAGAEQARALSVRLVASGLADPVHVAAPRSEPDRLYVVERHGRIRVIENGQLRAQPFLDIRNLVESGYVEQGLLSIAFHPRYARNRRFFVYYTDNNGDTRVVEYRSNGAVALAQTRRQVLFVDQPYVNHNGGQLAFGPDGRLYIGLGDGGSAGDPHDVAQNLRSRLGKILALNADRRDAQPQINGYGLRNPWRFSFDRRTGDLYVGDVGQNRWEEVSFVPRRNRVVENYGWDAFEGRERFERKQPNARGRLVAPIVVYPLGGAHCSVAGGFVYRGSSVPAARGRYFYGDYCSGTVWSLRVIRGRARGLRRERFRVNSLSSFGEDARGELYLASMQSGRIYRLAP